MELERLKHKSPPSFVLEKFAGAVNMSFSCRGCSCETLPSPTNHKLVHLFEQFIFSDYQIYPWISSPVCCC